MSNFYILDEREVWHKAIAKEAKLFGFNPIRIFSADDVNDPGWVFMRPHATPHILKRNQEDYFTLLDMGCSFIQDRTQIDLYEDKWSQSARFEKWMPLTFLGTRYQESFDFSVKTGFPIVSKANVGASSVNVRIIYNEHELSDHLERIFSGAGVKVNHCDSKGTTSMQKGYAILQEFIPHDRTYRVNVIGNGRAVFKRYNYPDKPVAQTGNVSSQKIIDQDLLEFADQVAEDINTKWCALDILKRPSGEFALLETSLAWPWPATKKDIADAPIFRTKYKWVNLFRCMFEELKNGEFDGKNNKAGRF